jgi:hypothetical protein
MLAHRRQCWRDQPIASSVETEDTALTPDRRFLLSCDGGGNFRPVSVIDLMT